MLYLEKPEDFNPKFEVVSCFFEYENEILLLLRQDHKNEPNTYGVPAGKVKRLEKPNKAIIREIGEETGIHLKDNELSYFKEVFVKYPTYEFIYHIYHHKGLKEKPNIKINPEEHKRYIRKKPIEALKEDLIQELDGCIKLFYKI